ncbi:MAG: hypothetical protein DMG21_13165 [Acidobacteria bacterium]|nr:MAG: hypothetical protein DMG21_13165 [Acidobacteriota bacterium]
MGMLSRLSSLVRTFFRRQCVERELDDEVRGYVELLTAEKMRTGMTEKEARRQAMIETGGTEQVKERVREVRIGAFFETLLKDARYGLRQLRRSPGFTAVAVITLGLGIGATTAMFSLIDAVLLQGMPYQNPHRLVAITTRNAQGEEESVAPGDCNDWKAHIKAFKSLAA